MLCAVFAIILFVASAANGQSGGFQQFDKIDLPPGLEPTSAAAVTSDESGYVHLFYRGNEMQLIHVYMKEDGSIVWYEKLPSLLLTAPSAVAPEVGALDVAYVTLEQTVVLRSFRDGAWSSSRPTGMKSEFTPAVDVTEDGVTVYATQLNMEVGATTKKNGVWGPIQNRNFVAMDGPVALNGELFARDSTNKVFRLNVGSPNSLIPGPTFTSGMCAMQVGEGGLFLLGRDVTSGLIGNARFGGSWFEVNVPGSPWISDAPGCYMAYSFCSEVIVRQGNAFYRTEYCN